MMKYASLFALILAACGPENEVVETKPLADCGDGYKTLPGDGLTYCLPLDENQPVTIIINDVADCDWETQDWNAAQGCVDKEEQDPETPEYCETFERRLHDRDGDGYGNPYDYITVSICEPWSDGYINWIDNRDDCDDTRSDIHPDAEEICDEVDNDCDDEIDEGVMGYFFPDNDGDGYGAQGSNGVTMCYPGEGWATRNGDCDDTSSFTYPGAPYEIWCDGVDHDCDGIIGEGCTDASFQDNDNDGYRPMDGDCDDTRSDINPDAEEICDGVDNDCDGDWDPMRIPIYCDSDGDGYGIDDLGCTSYMCPDHVMPPVHVLVAGDCHGLNDSIYPGAPEVCGDGIDQDCDGSDIECQIPPTPRTQLTVFLAPGSPSGQGIPGYGEILRFSATADLAGDLDILAITFAFQSTDNAETNWNSCAELSNPVRWSLYDVDDLSTDLDDNSDWDFSDADGWCNDDLDKVTLDLAGNETNGSPWIGPGATTTFSIHFDSFGASSSEDDVVRIKIVDILWSDGVNHFHDDTVQGLPLVGGVIDF